MKLRIYAFGLAASSIAVLAILWPWLTGTTMSFFDIFIEANREGILVKWSGLYLLVAVMMSIVFAIQFVKTWFAQRRARRAASQPKPEPKPETPVEPSAKVDGPTEPEPSPPG